MICYKIISCGAYKVRLLSPDTFPVYGEQISRIAVLSRSRFEKFCSPKKTDAIIRDLAPDRISSHVLNPGMLNEHKREYHVLASGETVLGFIALSYKVEDNELWGIFHNLMRNPLYRGDSSIFQPLFYQGLRALLQKPVTGIKTWVHKNNTYSLEHSREEFPRFNGACFSGKRIFFFTEDVRNSVIFGYDVVT